MRNYYTDGTVEDLNYGEYVENGTNKWLGWICWAGVEQIVITSKGDVMRAWCVQDWLGNIYQDNVKFPRYPVFCTKSYCHCGEDIMIKRQKFVPL